MDPRNRVKIVAGGLHSLARRAPATQGFFVELYAVLSRIPILGPLVFEPLGRVLRLKVTTPVFAWGSNMGPSQLGVAGISGSQVPVSVGSNFGDRPVVALAAGGTHSLALTADGTVWGWGRNTDGQLGDGTNVNREVPVKLTTLPGPCIAIAAGDQHSLAITAEKVAYAWGNNVNGQLGDGTTNTSWTPVPVSAQAEDGTGVLPSGPLNDVLLVAGGLLHSLAVLEGGGVLVWGSNQFGQCGRPAPSTAPLPGEPVPPGNYLRPIAVMRGPALPLLAKSIAAASGFSAIALPTAQVFTCGGIEKILSGAIVYDHTPTEVPGLSGIVAVAAHSQLLALDVNGNVHRYRVGAPQAPVQVPGISNVVEIRAGSEHYLALDSAGTVWAWGGNSMGQLGDGTNLFRAEPAPVQFP
ncbi:MAG: hypothetical protein HY727_12380 [Candidatus Rokubacteria bacterium]|nr:hypothetical protein [Candidatus Rokubacteria bacterium]